VRDRPAGTLRVGAVRQALPLPASERNNRWGRSSSSRGRLRFFVGRWWFGWDGISISTLLFFVSHMRAHARTLHIAPTLSHSLTLSLIWAAAGHMKSCERRSCVRANTRQGDLHAG